MEYEKFRKENPSQPIVATETAGLRPDSSDDEIREWLRGRTIAVPGLMTSAYLALQLYLGEFDHVPGLATALLLGEIAVPIGGPAQDADPTRPRREEPACSGRGAMSCRPKMAGAIALCVLVLLAGAARAETMEQLYEKAKLEKSLVLYSGAGPAAAKAAGAAFEKRFPGIAVTAKGDFSNVLDQEIDRHSEQHPFAARELPPAETDRGDVDEEDQRNVPEQRQHCAGHLAR